MSTQTIPLKLYNTLTRKKMEFIPIDTKENNVGLYTCGPTVYDFAHIGNLRTYVFEDILKRTLHFNGYKVKHIMNITDVGHLTDDSDCGEDKMEKGAQRQGKTVWDIAEKYAKAFKENLKDLNILYPDVWCKATDHIQHQIDLVQRLEKKGMTYQLEDGIYYDTSKFGRYADFARLDIENIKAGARIEVVQGKRNPTDFALWKFSPKDGAKRQMEWDSPWGVGFPGWHIECSAMSSHYLGDQFDIHCGGIDHVPIHHTNEIAQIESLTEKQWVNYWLHGEFLVIQNEDKIDRMGKSEGNFLTLETLKYDSVAPLAYRYFLLNAHYRHQLVFKLKAVQSAQNGFDNFKEKVIKLRNQVDESSNIQEEQVTKYNDSFLTAINDDLNTPKALAVCWQLLDDKEVNAAAKLQLLDHFDEVLGLNIKEMQEEEIDIPEEITQLAKEREQARKEKNWAKADAIRDEIDKLGYKLYDTPEGIKIGKK